MAPFFLEGEQLEIGSTKSIGNGRKRALVEIIDDNRLLVRPIGKYPVYAGNVNPDETAFEGHTRQIKEDTELTRLSLSTTAKGPQLVWKER